MTTRWPGSEAAVVRATASTQPSSSTSLCTIVSFASTASQARRRRSSVLVEDAAEELDAVATEGELLGPSSGREQEQEPHHFHEVNSFGCPPFQYGQCHFTVIA